MNSVLQRKPVSKAWSWGFADSMQGNSNEAGAILFVDSDLIDYLDGYKSAQCYARMYSGTLTHLALPAAVANSFDDNAPHRKYVEGRAMDADLAELREGGMQPIVRMTDELLEEIENALF